MAIRDILAHADASRSNSSSLGVAATLAVSHDAHLTGIHVEPLLAAPSYALYPVGPDLVEAHQLAVQERAKSARSAFDKAVAAVNVSSEWRQIEGDPAREVCTQSRCSDVVVVGQANSRDPEATPQQIVEDIILGASTPVLVVPYIGAKSGFGHKVLVAWDASRESARAIHDSAPFLRDADHVTVVTVTRGDSTRSQRPAASEVALHLARHGLDVTARDLPGAELSTGDALLSLVADESFELLVMGAYGHARLRELVLGGTTDHILRHMTVPVLMSH